MPSTDSGLFALTPGPVTAAHIRQLVKAGPGHAIAIGTDGVTVVIPWTATTALEDAGRHMAVWTYHEYLCLFGHQDKHKLTPTWQKKLAGVANRQYQVLIDGTDLDTGMWLRYPKPRDAMERLAHAVDLVRLRVRADPEREEKLRGMVAVLSPLADPCELKSGYDLTFGDLDELYRRLLAADTPAAPAVDDTNG